MILNHKTGCLVTGTVSNEPAFKSVGTAGTPLLTFGVRYGQDENKNGKFVDVNVWGNQAIAMNGLIHKGDCILAAGELKQEEYNGKKYTRISTYGEVFPAYALAFSMMSSKDGGTEQAAPAPAPAADDEFKVIDDDNEDLPF